jgi:tetratricopeptide (TPR) repeat protein
MLRLALLFLWSVLGILPAQQIAGTYRLNDLDGLRDAVRNDQENVGLRLRLAQALLRRGQELTHPDDQVAILRESQAQFERVLATDPDAQIPLRLMALDSYVTNRLEDVVRYGERLLAIVPTDIQVSRRVLKALVRLGRIQEAVDFLAAWLRRGAVPGLGVLQGLISTLSMREDFRNRFEEAMKVATRERPRDVQLLLYQAIYYSEIGRMEKAWEVMHAAEALGLCDERSGERHALVRSLKSKSVEHGANPVSYTGTDLGELDQAVARAPAHAGVILRRARVLDLSGRREDALAGYAAALELNPDLWPASYRRGELLLDLGRAAEAVPDLEKARSLFPDLILVRLRAAEARARAGQTAEAVALLVEDARVNEPVSLSQAAIDALANQGPEALSLLRAALEEAAGASPTNPYLAAYLSAVCLVAKDVAAARRYALECERRGLAGPDAWPHRLLYQAFGEAYPQGYPLPPRLASGFGPDGGRDDGSQR